MTIHFKKGEYDLYMDDESVGIPLDMIKKKIISRNFQRFANISERISARRKELEQAGLDMVALEWWLELHSKRYKSGYLSPAKGLMMLKAFAELLHEADVNAVNLALQKVVAMNNPEKCTMAYLRAILRSPQGKKPTPNPSQEGNADGNACAPRGKNIGGNICAPKQPESIWNDMMARLERRIRDRSFNTWLRPMRFLSFSEGVLRIEVPDHTYTYWLNTYYIQAIRDEWHAAGGVVCRIEIIA